jgi:hypothetical protein
MFYVVQEIQEETFKLPREGPIRKDLLQRISRLAGAFTENFGNDIVSPQSVFLLVNTNNSVIYRCAYRLNAEILVRFSSQNGLLLVPFVKFVSDLISSRTGLTHYKVQEFTAIPILSYIPPVIPDSTPVPTSIFPHTYSLYPFLSPRSLPWSMNTSGAFRIRRVGEWLGGNTTEDVQKTGGLSEGRGRVVTMDRWAILFYS